MCDVKKKNWPKKEQQHFNHGNELPVDTHPSVICERI